MKLESVRNHRDSDSCSSYGHELRLRQRREGWPGEEKSRRISEGKRERLIAMVTKENYRIKEVFPLPMPGWTYTRNQLFHC
jgi:hypothetical protein